MKLLRNLFLVALAAFAFNACDDVPAPYTIPGGEDGDGEVSTEYGENLLTNSDMETWSNGKPENWGEGVSNSTIEQSSDAHGGSTAVLITGNSGSNKRFASKSYFLQPGTYKLSAYIKQSGETAGAYRIGYAKLTNGSVANWETDYIYLNDATTVPSEWEEVSAEFTIEEETEVSLIIMNSKVGNGAPILVDDIELKTTNGGLSEGESSTIDPDVVSEISAVVAAGPGDAKVQGTIIATYARGFIVSDNTGSILVYLGEDKGFVVGDVVTVSGATSTFAGMLQFGNSSVVEKSGTATVEPVEPTVMSATDMDAYLAAPVIKYVQYTGTLGISGFYYNVTIDGAATAIGSISYPNDGLVDASLDGKKIVVTGYTIGVSQSKYVNTMAVNVVAADGSETITPEEPVAQTYVNEALTSTFGSFTTTEVSGTYPWEIATQYSCAKVTGYSGSANEAESWMISNSFDLTNETEAYISFDYVIAYNSDDIVENHKVLISSDYTGDVTTATWVAINYNPVKSGVWTLENTGKIALPAEMYGKSNVTVAFKYTSSSNNASTWEVANVVVATGSADTATTPDEGGNEEGGNDDATAGAITFDFTNPVALTPSVEPGVVEEGSTQGVGVEFNDITFTNSNVNININQGTSTTPVRIWTRTGGDVELRTYKYSTVTISKSDGSAITGITFTGGKVSTMTASEGTFSAGKWSGSANSVTFSVSATLNIQSISVE